MDLPQKNSNGGHSPASKNNSNGIISNSIDYNFSPGFSGDSLRAVSSSAPPPGFYALAEQQQRDQTAAMLLQKPWQTSGVYFNKTDAEHNNGILNDEAEARQRRSMSYMNLAEALGESMAQSMEDSFIGGRAAAFAQNTIHESTPRRFEGRDVMLQQGSAGNSRSANHQSSEYQGGRSISSKQQHGVMAPVGGGRKPNAGSNDGLENIHRQSRHIASRLIGPKLTSGHLFLQPNTSRSANPFSTTENINVFSSSDSHPPNDYSKSHAETRFDPLRMTIEEPLGSASPDIERSIGKRSGTLQIGDNVDSDFLPKGNTTPESSSMETPQAIGSSSLRRAAEAARSGSAPPDVNFYFSETNSGTIQSTSNANFRSLSEFHSQVRLAPPAANTSQIQSSNTSTTRNDNNVNTDHEMEELRRTTEKELAPYLHDAFETSQHNKRSVEQRPAAHPSRSLCILAAFYTNDDTLSAADIRSICESFGVLDSFRSDFWPSRLVLFFSYFDLRCAQRAASGLLPALLRRVKSINPHRREAVASFKVKYCVPLQNSSPADDSTLMITNLPSHIDEQNVYSFMESFGGVRSVHYVAPTNAESLDDENTSYMVEFYDIQDSKHALMEMQSTAPWGAGVLVEVGMRNPTKRRQARDLLRLIGRWRLDERPSWTPPGGLPSEVLTSGNLSRHPSSTLISSDQGDAIKAFTPVSVSPLPSVIVSSPSPTMPTVTSTTNYVPTKAAPYPSQSTAAATSNTYDVMPAPLYPVNMHSLPEAAKHYQLGSHAPLVLGPDGQYSFIVHPNAYFAPHISSRAAHNIPQAHYMHDPGAAASMHQSYWPNQYASGQAIHARTGDASSGARGQHMQTAVAPSYIDVRTGYPIVTDSMAHLDCSASISSGSLPYSPHGGGIADGNAFASNSSCFSTEKSDLKNSPKRAAQKFSSDGQRPSTQSYSTGGQDGSLILSIEAVQTGADSRTSLMVRNIPNKYTQKMLLNEFQQDGHGTDKIDFFYLPIDFKNKCNRGYAFVNFVDYKDIIPFYNKYNRQSWRVFNSDKICDVTYARIQGKAAMLRRFEHSALFEKDDEYRPLAFVSHGPNKGQPEQFSSCSARTTETS